MTFIYALPLWLVFFIITVCVLVWAALQNRPDRKWKLFNVGLLLLSLAVILYATVLHRTPGTQLLIQIPFYSFELAKQQPELYREVLMNVFLFVPFGLSLSSLLPTKWSFLFRIFLCCLLAFWLSTLVEYLQYRFCLGLSEADDVIFNTLGALVGASQLIFAGLWRKHIRKC